MILFPAIDLIQGEAVRLFQGDYRQKTVYSKHPEEVAAAFAQQGASHVHLVDLEGARDGGTPNLETVLRIRESSGLFCEIGGGIRDMRTVDLYLEKGLDRVILGTAAAENESFLIQAVRAWGDKIAAGVDIRNGFAALRGWTEQSSLPFREFCRHLQEIGVRTVICTDISRDGAMRGTNLALYRELSESLEIQITASGEVSSLEDVKALRRMNLYGAIVGKAWYTGELDLREAIEAAK